MGCWCEQRRPCTQDRKLWEGQDWGQERTKQKHCVESSPGCVCNMLCYILCYILCYMLWYTLWYMLCCMLLHVVLHVVLVTKLQFENVWTDKRKVEMKRSGRKSEVCENCCNWRAIIPTPNLPSVHGPVASQTEQQSSVSREKKPKT